MRVVSECARLNENCVGLELVVLQVLLCLIIHALKAVELCLSLPGGNRLGALFNGTQRGYCFDATRLKPSVENCSRHCRLQQVGAI